MSQGRVAQESGLASSRHDERLYSPLIKLGNLLSQSRAARVLGMFRVQRIRSYGEIDYSNLATPENFTVIQEPDINIPLDPGAKCEGEISIDILGKCANLVCSAAGCEVSKLPNGERIGRVTSDSVAIKYMIKEMSRLELPAVCTRLSDCPGMPALEHLPDGLK